MNEKEIGYVYILTNPSFKDNWVKIGKSSRPVDVRSKELDNTAVPLPFEIYATLKTSKYSEVEKKIHKEIDRFTDFRIRQGREFFNVPPKVALDILKEEATLLDDAEITLYENNLPTQDQKEKTQDTPKAKRSNFKFSMVGINIGEFVTFSPLNIDVKVASDDSVEYQDRIYKLSPFTGTFMPDNLRTPSGAYQGANYFTYKGKKLSDLRKEMEAKETND